MADRAEHIPDNLDIATPEVIANDNALLEGEVGAEVLDVSQKVDEIERIGWLKEFLGLYNTKIADLRVKELDKRRAANENKLNKDKLKEAA